MKKPLILKGFFFIEMNKPANYKAVETGLHKGL